HHTTLAFNAACKILEMSGRFVLGGKPMGIGIGLHAGKAIVGNIGSQTKIEYTAVGDTVNIAARLQELTKLFHQFPIIMSTDVQEELVGHPYHHAISSLGMQKVRGKNKNLVAFGFRPIKDRPLSMAQGARGLHALAQDQRGVGKPTRVKEELSKV
ncbi:MAG: adenylate/guanylate cyclase domain-containing protein, partial [Desulfatiglandales bacterium]